MTEQKTRNLQNGAARGRLGGSVSHSVEGLTRRFGAAFCTGLSGAVALASGKVPAVRLVGGAMAAVTDLSQEFAEEQVIFRTSIPETEGENLAAVVSAAEIAPLLGLVGAVDRGLVAGPPPELAEVMKAAIAETCRRLSDDDAKALRPGVVQGSVARLTANWLRDVFPGAASLVRSAFEVTTPEGSAVTLQLLLPDSVLQAVAGEGGHKADVRPAAFQELTPSGPAGETRNLDLLLDVGLCVRVELGRTSLKVQEVLELGPGSVVELDKLAGEPVDLLVNEQLFARGEVVVIDENFGVRVTDIVSPVERIQAMRRGKA